MYNQICILNVSVFLVNIIHLSSGIPLLSFQKINLLLPSFGGGGVFYKISDNKRGGFYIKKSQPEWLGFTEYLIES